jgi:hypothetical protein
MKRPCKSSDFANREMKIRQVNNLIKLPGVPSGNWKVNYLQMKYISAILFFCLAFGGACKKTTPSANPALVFGSICEQCFIYYKTFYSIHNGALYHDTDHYTAKPVNFSPVPLAQAQYLIAKPLLDDFPQYLRNGVGGSLGFNGDAHGMILHFEFTDNLNNTVKWDINPDTSLLPVAVRYYIQQVNSLMPSLQ